MSYIQDHEFKSDKPVVFDPPVQMLVWDLPSETIDDIPTLWYYKVRDICAYIPCKEYPFIVAEPHGTGFKHGIVDDMQLYTVLAAQHKRRLFDGKDVTD